MWQKWLCWGILATSLIPHPLLAEQKVIQQGSTSATAVGRNNFAASRVHQSANQTRQENSGQQQVIEQEGDSSVVGNGQDNTVVNDIIQSSQQNQDRRVNSHNQQGIQRARGNASATGTNNRIISNTGQYNLQHQWSY